MQPVARQCRKPLAMLSEALIGAVRLSRPSLSLIPGSGPFEVFPEPALCFPTLVLCYLLCLDCCAPRLSCSTQMLPLPWNLL